jgi:ketosteroid isomerase-like protein
MDMSEEAGIANELRARWACAFAVRDLDGLAALYAPDALFFGSTPELFRGHAGVKAYFAGLSPDVVLEAFEEPELVRVAPGAFATAGFWRFTFGAEPRRYRLTWVIAAREEGWRIVQNHAARCDI